MTDSYSGPFRSRGGSSVQRFADSSRHLCSWSSRPIPQPLSPWAFIRTRNCSMNHPPPPSLELKTLKTIAQTGTLSTFVQGPVSSESVVFKLSKTLIDSCRLPTFDSTTAIAL